MKSMLSSIKGMNDFLPDITAVYRTIEQCLQAEATRYDYHEIRMPLLEQTALFERSIGEVTDIVQKEMYTFVDHYNQDRLTLRPEGTASCVRACIQHGLLHNQTQRLWYQGPMFRHENPQKGRYRQFHQFGIETFGFGGIGIEVEQLALISSIWRCFGLQDQVMLRINTLGTAEERHAYVAELKQYLSAAMHECDEALKQRAMANPLRILDSKSAQMAPIIAKAPRLFEMLSIDSQQRFDTLCAALDAVQIAYVHDPLMVRGLDYYAHTVFEWTTDHLGAQATVCGGGRYDGLVEQIGGKSTTAFGFAMGIERLKLLIEAAGELPVVSIPQQLYVILEKNVDVVPILAWIEHCRMALPDCRLIVDYSQSAVKHQLKRADKHAACAALIFRAAENKIPQEVQIKPLGSMPDRLTVTVEMDRLISAVQQFLKEQTHVTHTA